MFICCKQNFWTGEFEYICEELNLDNDFLIKQAYIKQDVVPRAWSHIHTKNAAAPSPLESNSNLTGRKISQALS